MKGIKPIREIMYEDNNINAFCKDNPFYLKEKDLAIASSWKNHFSGRMISMRHLAEYTVFYLNNKINSWSKKASPLIWLIVPIYCFAKFS